MQADSPQSARWLINPASPSQYEFHHYISYIDVPAECDSGWQRYFNVFEWKGKSYELTEFC